MKTLSMASRNSPAYSEIFSADAQPDRYARVALVVLSMVPRVIPIIVLSHILVPNLFYCVEK